MSGTDDAETAERMEALVEQVEIVLDNLGEYLDDPEAEQFDDLADRFDDDELSELIGYVRDLVEVADEAEDLLGEIDLASLPEAVDAADLAEAVETGKIPDAIEERDPTEAIELRALLSAVELTELWDSADVRRLWQEKRELDAELDDVTGDDGDDDSLLDTDDDSMLDADGSMLDTDDGSLLDTDMDVDMDMDDVGGPGDVPSEAYQTKIQQKAMGAVDEFREGMLEAHDELKALREKNREKMRRKDTSTSSRNPTAHSTIPTERGDIGQGTRYSTVPKETRYSTAPNRKRIYGNRFDDEGDSDG